jgi:hypothetical protein
MAAIEVGSIWKRRVVPATDDGWSTVEVTGVFDQQEGIEVCVRPATGFGRVLSVAPADLEAAFDLEQTAPPSVARDIFDTGGAWV